MPRLRSKSTPPGLDKANRAAQYLRMSTEHQRYSVENQAFAISNYAQQHGLMIVHTYQDGGRSGLQIRGRPALQQLIAEAMKSLTS
jgi:DNA invertase Pin-like site-specific DNA recombinase